MKIEYIKVKELHGYEFNTRTHSDEQVSQLAASIGEFGFTNPLLIDGERQIIAGHGRLAAATKIGMEDVPCIVLDHLTEAQRRAYVIADNKLALNAGWDEDLLKLELSALDQIGFDLSVIGFDDYELAGLVIDDDIAGGLTDEDDVPEVAEIPISKQGDIWLLDNHRVMCGDSTSIDDVDKLVQGGVIDMVFTDPPYNVAFNGRSGKHDVIKNDNLSDSDFVNFIDDVIQVIKTVDPKVYYIWCNWKFYSLLQNKLDYKCCIVWAKNVFGLGIGYRHQHEFCLFNGKIDEQIKNESDLWEVKKDSKYMHPTQKPVELSVRAFSNHIKLINVLDLFGGSGSTLIGAQQTNRNAFIMELDPIYVDVIVKRWQEYTGKQAVHEVSGLTFDEVVNG
jgi:DNA modification methylase